MKAQSSTEFMVFVSIGIIVLIIYFGVSHTYLDSTLRQKEIISGQDLAKELRNEINLATRVEDNYYRTIQLPYKVGGKDFEVTFKGREVIVNVEGNEYVELLADDIGGYGGELTASPGENIIINKMSSVVNIIVPPE